MTEGLEKIRRAMNKIDLIFQELRRIQKRSPAVSQDSFLGDRKPLLMVCPDGTIRAVTPAMNSEEIGTNVIPLPVKRRES